MATLLEKVKSAMQNDRRAIQTAIINDQSLEFIEQLVQNGANINVRDSMGNGVLHHAAYHSREDLLDYFLGKGIKPNEKNNMGHTVLHAVINKADVNLVRFLLERGVNPNTKDNEENNVLHTIVQSRDFDFRLTRRWHVQNNDAKKKLRLCFDYGADVSAVNSKGCTVLELLTTKLSDANAILEQIAKLEALGQSICETDRRIIKEYRFYREYYAKCRRELKDIKYRIIYKNLSLFDILAMSYGDIRRYIRNKEFNKALQNQKCDRIFPIYFPTLFEKYQYILKKQELMEKTVDVLMEAMEPVNLSTLFMEKVVLHLSENDMLRLVKD